MAASLWLCFNLKLRVRRDGSNGKIQTPKERHQPVVPVGGFFLEGLDEAVHRTTAMSQEAL